MADAKRNEPEKLMSAKEVAELLGVHVQTLWKMARGGDIQGIKIGADWRFRPSDITAWQEAKAAREVA